MRAMGRQRLLIYVVSREDFGSSLSRKLISEKLLYKIEDFKRSYCKTKLQL